MFLHKSFWLRSCCIIKKVQHKLDWISVVWYARSYFGIWWHSSFPVTCRDWSQLVFTPLFFATFLLTCARVHALSYHICVHVSVCVHATVTTAIDRSPCRASCHAEKGNTDSERDREEDWRGNLPSDNCIVLHLLLLTVTTCRSQSLQSLCTKHFLRTEDVKSIFSQNTLKQAHSLL